MRKIYKYPLQITDEQEVFLQGDDPEVLTAQVQNGQLTLWAVVDPNLEAGPVVKIRIIGTGNPMPDMEGFYYVNTVQMPPLVWHVWAEE